MFDPNNDYPGCSLGFLSLYKLANLKDKQGLREKTRAGINLDAWFGSFRLITLFAEEGRKDIVNFLLDEFGLSIDYAAEGYARAGNKSQVEKLIKQGASIFSIANGYAYGGYKKQIEELFPYLIYKAGDAIIGYALGGFIEEVNALLKPSTRNYAILGFALSGRKDLVNRLISSKQEIYVAIFAYAWGGHFTLVQGLTRKAMIKMELAENAALRGYAAGGHVAWLEKLAIDNVSEVASFYGQYGHSLQASKLTELKDQESALKGALDKGNMPVINTLINMQAQPDDFIKHYWERNPENQVFLDPKEYVTNYPDSLEALTRKLKRMVSMVDNPLFRRYLIEYINKKIPFFHVDKIIHETSFFNKGMKTYHLSYPQVQKIKPVYLQVWFREGPQLIQNKKLSLQVFVLISQFLLGSSIKATKELVDRYLEVKNIENNETLMFRA